MNRIERWFKKRLKKKNEFTLVYTKSKYGDKVVFIKTLLALREDKVSSEALKKAFESVYPEFKVLEITKK